jgi:hypothetical protein
MMYRAKQGIPLQRNDLDLINATIEVLKGYIPAPSGIVPDGNPADGAPKRLLILRKRLELLEKTLSR